MMTTLTVTTRGQATFRKDVLKHLGIQPGGRIRLDASWDDLKGFFSGKTNGARLSIEELNDAIVVAGAAAGSAGLDGT